jgi:hypothetical protein
LRSAEHGRQYDVSDPADPKLTGQLWLGGVLGKPDDAGRGLDGGPNMLPRPQRPPLSIARTRAQARQVSIARTRAQARQAPAGHAVRSRVI